MWCVYIKIYGIILHTETIMMANKLVWLFAVVLLVTLITDSSSKDIKTKSGLRDLYNEKVVKVEHVRRPMSSSGKKLPLPHHGARSERIYH